MIRGVNLTSPRSVLSWAVWLIAIACLVLSWTVDSAFMVPFWILFALVVGLRFLEERRQKR